MTVKPKHVIATLIAGLVIGGCVETTHLQSASAHPVDPMRNQPTGEQVANRLEHVLTHALTATDQLGSREVRCGYYEDGSGYCYHGKHMIAEFDSGVFPWDCTQDGNGEC